MTIATHRNVDDVSGHVRLPAAFNIDAYIVKSDSEPTKLSEAGRIKAAADLRALEEAGLFPGNGFSTREAFTEAWINALDAGFDLGETIVHRSELAAAEKAERRRQHDEVRALKERQAEARREGIRRQFREDLKAYEDHLVAVADENTRPAGAAKMQPHTLSDFLAGRQRARELDVEPPTGLAGRQRDEVLSRGASDAALERPSSPRAWEL